MEQSILKKKNDVTFRFKGENKLNFIEMPDVRTGYIYIIAKITRCCNGKMAQINDMSQLNLQRRFSWLIIIERFCRKIR